MSTSKVCPIIFKSIQLFLIFTSFRWIPVTLIACLNYSIFWSKLIKIKIFVAVVIVELLRPDYNSSDCEVESPASPLSTPPPNPVLALRLLVKFHIFIHHLCSPVCSFKEIRCNRKLHYNHMLIYISNY